MKRISLLLFASVLLLSGCVARTYQLTQDRIDQSLTEGNRGYIMGTHPGTETPKKAERTVRVFEFEFGKRRNVNEAAPADTGYTQPEYSAPADFGDSQETEGDEIEDVKSQKYTVGKNDTLQKISQKFYGTTKNWVKIYKANKDTLKTPDRVYPGQVLNIPEEGIKTQVEPLKDPGLNLK